MSLNADAESTAPIFSFNIANQFFFYGIAYKKKEGFKLLVGHFQQIHRTTHQYHHRIIESPRLDRHS